MYSSFVVLSCGFCFKVLYYGSVLSCCSMVVLLHGGSGVFSDFVFIKARSWFVQNLILSKVVVVDELLLAALVQVVVTDM